MSSRRQPTNSPRSTSTASDRCRTPGHEKAARRPDSERHRADIRKTPLQGGRGPVQGAAFRAGAGPWRRENRLTSRSSARCSLTKCQRRAIRCGQRSRRLPSGIMASSETRRRVSMPVTWLPRGAAAAIRLEPSMESRAITTRRGLPGRSYWHGWVRSFRWRVPTVAAISG
jgi:hypothetical protein